MIMSVGISRHINKQDADVYNEWHPHKNTNKPKSLTSIPALPVSKLMEHLLHVQYKQN